MDQPREPYRPSYGLQAGRQSPEQRVRPVPSPPPERPMFPPPERPMFPQAERRTPEQFAEKPPAREYARPQGTAQATSDSVGDEDEDTPWFGCAGVVLAMCGIIALGVSLVVDTPDWLRPWAGGALLLGGLLPFVEAVRR